MPLAMTMYTLSVAIHVVFVAAFLGAANAFSVLGPMAKESPKNALFALKVERKIYETMIFPAIAIVWGTGAYQASDAKYKFGDELWLSISVVLFLIMSVLAALVIYPAVKTAQSELESQTEPGPPSKLAQDSLAKLGKTGPFMGVTFIVITFLMVAQPF